jgi:predicted dehydrogenase
LAVPVVGLIGCGHIGRFHSRNLRASIRSELLAADYVAVCDSIRERAEEFARITGAGVIASDAAEVFAQPGLTAVYVCTETSEHPALVIEAARRGLAVFCEKPLAKALAEVQEMYEAVEAAGVTNQVGLVLRHSPVFTVLKDLISAPDLGPLLTAHLRDDQFFPDHGHYESSWRNDFERAGGGTLIEHSIHDIDLFHWLFGPIASVRCHTRVTSGHDRIEDVAVATFQHAGGHQTTLSSIWHQVDARPSTRRLEIFFEGGWFATDHDFIGPITYQLRSGPEVVVTSEEVFERYVALTGLAEAEAELARIGAIEDYLFLKAVSDGRPAFPDFATALAAHRVVDACYRSARDGAEVRVAPVES